MEWKKIYPKHLCDNELTSKKIYKELMYLNSKKQAIQF